MSPPIVVGIEPSRHDADAPVLAALLARATGAPVVAVAVHESPRPAGEGAQLELRGAALARLAAVEPAFHGLPLETVAVAGPSAARVLRDVATERRAGLLVIGSTHHHAPGQMVGVSTAGRLAHGMPCPVAVAPAGFASRMRGLDRIGVAFVDSDEGYEALRAAAALAAACDAELHAITAIEPIAWSATSLIQPYDPGAHLEELRERAEASLRRALDRVAGDVPSHTQTVINNPAPALRQFSFEVDLLVCGSRGHGPLGSVLLGGVSRRLVHHAACPVIVVPRATEGALETLAGVHDALEGNRV